MLDFPSTTEFNKRIPKQKFYEQIEINSTLKQIFVNQIQLAYWRNKLAPSTMNVAAGEHVTEIEVFEIKLNSNILDETILRQIDKKIPYHILFLLEYEEKYQAWIGYKEAMESGKNAFKVSRYYHTGWLEENALPLHIEGLNMDTIYENFVRQIAGNALQFATSENLKTSVAKDEKRQLLRKRIETLQTKIHNEKQLNKQMQINSELKLLRKELEVLLYE
jgi:hypothetical protein